MNNIFSVGNSFEAGDTKLERFLSKKPKYPKEIYEF